MAQCHTTRVHLHHPDLPMKAPGGASNNVRPERRLSKADGHEQQWVDIVLRSRQVDGRGILDRMVVM
jgi:hypothetical protein